MGCPMLTAPPLTLTLLGSRPRALVLARTTTLNASLISHMSMSSCFTPVIFNTCTKIGIMYYNKNKQKEKRNEMNNENGGGSGFSSHVRIMGEGYLFLFFFSPFLSLITVLFHWDFSHRKFGLLSPGKASCNSHATIPRVRAGCFSVSMIPTAL